jgi:hypothetical protein
MGALVTENISTVSAVMLKTRWKTIRSQRNMHKIIHFINHEMYVPYAQTLQNLSHIQYTLKLLHQVPNGKNEKITKTKNSMDLQAKKVNNTIN